jgi:hypothetical protein
MFFCPRCSFTYDIRQTRPQKGGGVKNVINKILTKIEIKPMEISDLTLEMVTKHSYYRDLPSKKQEYVYNSLMATIPAPLKKKQPKSTSPIREAYFECHYCGFYDRIAPGTLIYQQSKETSEDSMHKDYSDLVYSDILPRTRKFEQCPNPVCKTRKEPKLKEAVMKRIETGTAYQMIYICTTCKHPWKP